MVSHLDSFPGEGSLFLIYLSTSDIWLRNGGLGIQSRYNIPWSELLRNFYSPQMCRLVKVSYQSPADCFWKNDFPPWSPSSACTFELPILSLSWNLRQQWLGHVIRISVNSNGLRAIYQTARSVDEQWMTATHRGS